ncbi:hypothetical protein AG1IA_09692 [Rhizoctonia solani AG-1 IA]|uniref:Uncharacterized protein n=1 Tax=Thanatephorus cucumeris (strain AG1-IA) TaxID=983506 RepID=L8WIX1_THACA|nr:hypothetical protein AG1IA_09692 [Rhizoctonia solani AG-1 IA]
MFESGFEVTLPFYNTRTGSTPFLLVGPMSSDTDSIWVCTRSCQVYGPARTGHPAGWGFQIGFTDQLDDSEGWEIGVGLGGELGPLWRGSVGHHESFEIAARDGVDLSNPYQLDDSEGWEIGAGLEEGPARSTRKGQS